MNPDAVGAVGILPSGQPAEGADTPEAIAVLEGAFDTLDGAWLIRGCCTCTSI